LRSVLALHPELVTIVARGGIREISDLVGKRIYVGPEGSGSRRTWEMLQQTIGWTESQAPQIVDMPADAAGGAMCAGAIDAILLVVGHPSKSVSALMARCAADLVTVDGPAVDSLVAGAPYLKKGRIPGALYGLTAGTPSFGVSAVLTTTAGIDDRIVAAFARALIGQIERLKTQDPALASLTVQDMISGSLPAPIHPAALQVFKELGLTK
jgi:TRAP transporter TAXI family solute receptor